MWDNVSLRTISIESNEWEVMYESAKTALTREKLDIQRKNITAAIYLLKNNTPVDERQIDKWIKANKAKNLPVFGKKKFPRLNQISERIFYKELGEEPHVILDVRLKLPEESVLAQKVSVYWPWIRFNRDLRETIRKFPMRILKPAKAAKSIDGLVGLTLLYFSQSVVRHLIAHEFHNLGESYAVTFKEGAAKLIAFVFKNLEQKEKFIKLCKAYVKQELSYVKTIDFKEISDFHK
jgi:hypothetical protein